MCGIEKHSTHEHICTNKNRFTDMESRLMFAKGGNAGKGMDWELGIGDANCYTLDKLNKVSS